MLQISLQQSHKAQFKSSNLVFYMLQLGKQHNHIIPHNFTCELSLIVFILHVGEYYATTYICI